MMGRGALMSELAAGFVVERLSTFDSAGSFGSKAVKLRESGASGLKSGSGFGGAAFAGEGAVCAGVSAFRMAVFGCVVSLVTGGLGAGLLVSGVVGEDPEDRARGETGGLLLAFRAASLGECLRFGGIGVPGF